jgi:hypothetical protein
LSTTAEKLRDVHGEHCLNRALAYFSKKLPSTGLCHSINVIPAPSHISSVITEVQAIIMVFRGNIAAAENNII